MNLTSIYIKLVSLTLLMASSVLSAAVPQPLDGEVLAEQVRQRIENITTEQLQQQLIKQPDTVVIDIRNAEEIRINGGMIDAPHITHIARGWLEYFVPQSINKLDTPIVVYCGTGQRSPFATETLKQLGYSNVKNYVDGFFDWIDKGLPVQLSDYAPDSMLYRKPQKVADGIWSAIGATAPPTYQNSGHNNNLSFIVTGDGVVVINASDNYLLAKSLHEEIRQITDQPVKFVILENAQGHAMLGSNYWKEQGAQIIAHRDAADTIKKYGKRSLERMIEGRRDKALGTRLAEPDIIFDETYELRLGDEIIQALYLGPAHSPGDISVWLPKRKLVIAGDIAFHQRMVFIPEHADTEAWVETWDNFADLDAEIVIPGHGEPTNMLEVTLYTRDYLVYMRNEMAKLIDQDKELSDAYKVDQSAYAHLDAFEELAKQNAGIIFRQMEF